MVAPSLEPALQSSVMEHLKRDVVTLRADQSVEAALAGLRIRVLPDEISYLYVLDAADRLVGIVPTRRLLGGALQSSIESIMNRNIVSIPEDATVFTACECFILYRYLALPVVDKEGRLLGVIDVGLFTDRVFDVAEREADEDVFQIIGAHVSRGLAASPLEGFRDRFPWLVCNIAAGIACALMAGRYEGLLKELLVLALFIPVILTLAESISMQSMTMALQALQSAGKTRASAYRALGREAATAILLGLASGCAVAGTAWIWKGQGHVALVIGFSILCSMTTSSLVGMALPSLLRAINRDPRIAAGPLVLAVSDIATLLLYLKVGATILDGAE